jgi:hypothetical protein
MGRAGKSRFLATASQEGHPRRRALPVLWSVCAVHTETAESDRVGQVRGLARRACSLRHWGDEGGQRPEARLWPHGRRPDRQHAYGVAQLSSRAPWSGPPTAKSARVVDGSTRHSRRMSERRPEEKLVAATITTTLGLKVTQHDDGKQPSMHDLNIVAAHGTFADVEDVAPKAGETGANAAAREGPQGEPATATPARFRSRSAGVPPGIRLRPAGALVAACASGFLA